jgi:Domain of unknown function (DUF4159)
MRFLRRTSLWPAGLPRRFLILWCLALVCTAMAAFLPGAGGLFETIRQLGLVGLFIVGLVCVVWGLERIAQGIEADRVRSQPLLDRRVLVAGETIPSSRLRTPLWNPLDPGAWYYGRYGQRLKQSLLILTFYTLAFLLVHLILSNLGRTGNSDVVPYELPPGGGGGGQQAAPRSVRIQKVIAPKFVINPYSSIIINVPPIDTINLKIADVTKELYAAGQGSSDGKGAGGSGRGFGSGSGFGFGSGSGTGVLRFIRLQHSDAHWDKNFGIGGDDNMLRFIVEKGGIPQKYVAEHTERNVIPQLASYPAMKSPPLVYVAGSQTFLLSVSEKRILRQYMLEQHGMVLGDNIGGGGFHNQFISTMNEVTGVQAVKIPRDDPIHRQPYPLPELPIVVAHGGTAPYGWKVDGRWVAYYHPGALSDAWRDDHAGIKRDVHEACYQLGINIMLYAHEETYKWRESQKP